MKTKWLFFAFILSLTPAVASAATIEFAGMGKAEIVSVAGVRNVMAWAGELNWTWLDGKPAGSDNTFYSFCVDLLNNGMNRQTVDVSTTGAMGTANYGAQKAAWLFNTYAPLVHGGYGTGAMAAGLQLAIWEVLYDDGLSLTAGSTFYVTYASAGAFKAGAEYLGELNKPDTNYMTASATWLNAPTGLGQDQIIRTPEPGTLLLLGTGLVGLLARRARKTSQA